VPAVPAVPANDDFHVVADTNGVGLTKTATSGRGYS